MSVFIRFRLRLPSQQPQPKPINESGAFLSGYRMRLIAFHAEARLLPIKNNGVKVQRFRIFQLVLNPAYRSCQVVVLLSLGVGGVGPCVLTHWENPLLETSVSASVYATNTSASFGFVACFWSVQKW